MLELGTFGSVRGVPGNGYPYRNPQSRAGICFVTLVGSNGGAYLTLLTQGRQGAEQLPLVFVTSRAALGQLRSLVTGRFGALCSWSPKRVIHCAVDAAAPQCDGTHGTPPGCRATCRRRLKTATLTVAPHIAALPRLSTPAVTEEHPHGVCSPLRPRA
jgi:hypothetical protein